MRLDRDRIIIDPTTGALGYGLEYTYSVMERDRMAALTQQDERLQFPMICNMAKEVWKTKEAKEDKSQGILWEGMTAVSLLLAGANLAVLRHPETLRYIKNLFGMK